MNKKILRLIDDLKALNRENIFSIINFNQNRILVVFNELNLNNLLKNSKFMKKFEKASYVPIFLTRDHIDTSYDVFPLEYINMKSSYNIVYGEDILKDIQISDENIRLESEQKIKGALIRITQVILEEGDKIKRLKNVCFMALEELELGIKGILSLKGIASGENRDDLEVFEQETNINIQPIIEIRNWKNKIEPSDAKKLIFDFYENIEELANFIDKMTIEK